MTTATAKTFFWDKIEKFGRDQHRMARCHRTGQWSIFDNSGTRPHLTDDGALWVDIAKPVHFFLHDGRICAEVPCLQDRCNNEPTKVWSILPVGMWCVKELKMDFEMSKEFSDIKILFETLELIKQCRQLNQ